MFNVDQFARQLLIEALFYDEEYGAARQRQPYRPRERAREATSPRTTPSATLFLIEEAVEWEDLDADEDGEIDYALAVDGQEHSTYSTPEETADTLLELAREHNLAPSFMILFEEEAA